MTEANIGDISVAKTEAQSRDRRSYSGCRLQITEEQRSLDIEFIQLLQDMIVDLSGAPEPVQIKLFSQDASLPERWAPKVADAVHKVPGAVDILNGIENTISGPAVTFQIEPSVASRAGFTPEEIAVDASAMLGGEPAVTPISNDRLYTVRVRFRRS